MTPPMKVHVPSIPDEGKDFAFDQREEWFSKLLQERMSEAYTRGDSASARVHLDRVNENVTAAGTISVQLKPICSRCAKPITQPLEVPFLWHLTAYLEAEHPQHAGEELELNADDLDFSFYRDDQIDLGQLVMEELLLALPLRFLCREECLGLCPRCGANRNETPCSCADSDPTHPFAPLQNFKAKP